MQLTLYFNIYFKDLFHLHVCVCVCASVCLCLFVYMFVSLDAHRGQKEMSDPLELVLQAFVSCLARVLESELQLSDSVLNALDR